MKLRTFVAPNITKVMREVREALGDDAIIVSTTTQDDGSVRITAALDQPDGGVDAGVAEALAPAADPIDVLTDALTYHGVPVDLISRFAGLAEESDLSDPTLRLAAVFEDVFRFLPHVSAGAAPVMLVGPPGAGKSATTAKLAARATLAGKKVSVVTIDTTRPAASQQLEAFTKILGIELKHAETPQQLGKVLRGLGRGGPVFIDSDGVNPFDNAEMARLVEFVEMSEIGTTLVLPGGMDPLEASDVTDAFRVLRPFRLITTRIDMARRLGAIVTTADTGGLAFGEIGVAPQIADGLAGLNPASLAWLLMRDPFRLDMHFQNSEAAE